MKVSVIVPVYQVEKYVAKCLDSIVNQTYKEIEIIIVDDGSTDLSGQICNQYALSDNRIQVIHKKNGGLMSAWLEGLKYATGEYLFFVDSDDWIDTDSIEKMVEIVRNTDVDIVCANYYVEYDGGRFADRHTILPGLYTRKRIKEEILPNLINDGKYLSRGIRICRWGKLIRKTCLEPYTKYCNLKVSIGEDMNIMVPVIAKSNSIFIMEDSFFYHYRMNNESIMKKVSDGMWTKVLILHHTMQGIIDCIGDDSLKSQEIQNYCDLSVMVIGKELKMLSFRRKNLQTLYSSKDYNFLKRNISLERYSGIEKIAARVICNPNGIVFAMCKIVAVFNSFLDNGKAILRKSKGRKSRP